MPEKRNLYSSYGQKLITIFARLLFSGESYSLIQLSKMLDCSKQTVLRIIDDIRRSYGIEIQESFKGRQKYFQIKKESGGMPPAQITGEEILVLQMCRAFTQHLLGRKLFEETAVALGKSRKLLADPKELSTEYFASMLPGTIDYTAHHETIITILKSMDKMRVCKVQYRNVSDRRKKRFYIKPFKLFSYKDSLYLHAGMAMAPGKRYREPDFDPLLAVHRIRGLQITERSFSIPENYDFERDFNQTFGIFKEETFNVEVRFYGWASIYVAERTWSPNQKITQHRDGSLTLKFQASSEPELISWVLSFKDEARILRPKWLVSAIEEIINNMNGLYRQAKSRI
jgi:predicted DNA-binding transcriptional regulator YafY